MSPKLSIFPQTVLALRGSNGVDTYGKLLYKSFKKVYQGKRCSSSGIDLGGVNPPQQQRHLGLRGG